MVGREKGISFPISLSVISRKHVVRQSFSQAFMISARRPAISVGVPFHHSVSLPIGNQR